jgi:hypothetical protein
MLFCDDELYSSEQPMDMDGSMEEENHKIRPRSSGLVLLLLSLAGSGG